MSGPTKYIEELNTLMTEYKQESLELEKDCHNVNKEIDRLMEIRNSRAKPHQDKLAEIESKIRQPMIERAATFVCSYGKINYRKGAVRRTWNLDALDQICNSKPEIKEEIWAFREEKLGEPSISIKLDVI